MSKRRRRYGVFPFVLLMSVFLVVFLSSCGSEAPPKPEPAPEKVESTQAPAEAPPAEQAAQEEKAPAAEPTPAPAEQASEAEMPGGGPIVFSDTKAMPPVTFQHEAHASKGLDCTDCHTGVFPMQKGATPKADLTMAAMREGKTCGTCHNGDKAFTAAANCTKCHAR